MMASRRRSKLVVVLFFLLLVSTPVLGESAEAFVANFIMEALTQESDLTLEEIENRFDPALYASLTRLNQQEELSGRLLLDTANFTPSSSGLPIQAFWISESGQNQQSRSHWVVVEFEAEKPKDHLEPQQVRIKYLLKASEDGYRLTDVQYLDDTRVSLRRILSAALEGEPLGAGFSVSPVRSGIPGLDIKLISGAEEPLVSIGLSTNRKVLLTPFAWSRLVDFYRMAKEYAGSIGSDGTILVGRVTDKDYASGIEIFAKKQRLLIKLEIGPSQRDVFLVNGLNSADFEHAADHITEYLDENVHYFSGERIHQPERTGKIFVGDKRDHGNTACYLCLRNGPSEPEQQQTTSAKYDDNTASSGSSSPVARPYRYRSLLTGGTVHVRSYYRKDGTYVRAHTRRSPQRR